MNVYDWFKSLKIDDLPDRPDYGAMWADGGSKKPKIPNPKSKRDYKKFTDMSRKFPYIIGELFNKFGFKNYLEIGVAYGGGLRLVTNSSSQAIAYGIDPIDDGKDGKLFNNFKSRNGKGRGGYDGEIFSASNVKFFMKRSSDSEVLSFFKDNLTRKIDFLNIDGDHEYEGCLFDLLNYHTVVADNGIIWVDDVASHEGVTKALEQFMKENNEFEIWDWNGLGRSLSPSGIDGVFLLRKQS
jgi:hypothetical protein